VPGRRRRVAEDVAMLRRLRQAFECYSTELADSSTCWLLNRDSGTGDTEPGLPAGTRIGDFEIVAEVGRGGMGVVYRAWQHSLGREIAIKILPDYARHDASARQRFQAESRAAARIHHTNVVAIHARGEHDGQYYYAMELIDGPSLDQLIRTDPAWFHEEETGKPAAPADYRHLARRLVGIAEGMACAHHHGVVHRDIKPHNILVGGDDRLYLTDFGVARLAEEPHLTEAGDVLGTPAYLSPEQLRGEIGTIDHRTDVYAFGVTLYEILTRRRPFAGKTRAQIMTEVLTGTVEAPRRINPDLPVGLETICLRAMDRDPARRYPTASALVEDLRRFAEGRPILTRRPGPIVRTGRWIGRHRAQATIAAAAVLLVVIVTAWTGSARAGRLREARHHVQTAYETLAYLDYRDEDLVAENLERAEALGAPEYELTLALALAHLGARRHDEALAAIDTLLTLRPGDLRAEYLLAWALWRTDDRAGSREVVARADARPGRPGADGWFFRGLAVHRDEPQEARESYRRAIELRAEAHKFYPQAGLHLARANSQSMYAGREIGPFDESKRTLRQLAEQGVYGAYPHYLLSIAHRLAAEIYSGSEGAREGLVRAHFEESLEWARLGRDLEPGYDRPMLAEAMCLESMGAFAEAEASRTEAIALADHDQAEWEGRHYRWRLRFWLGDFDGALEDLKACEAFAPGDVFYGFVYPALVLHDLERPAEALSLARSLGRDASGARRVIWAATTLRLLGAGDEARTLLLDRQDSVDYEPEADTPGSEAWLRTLYRNCIDGDDATSRELEHLADAANKPWQLWGESSFHAGARRMAAGDGPGALGDFGRAFRSYDGETRFTYHGKVLWHRLRRSPWDDDMIKREIEE